LKKHFTLIILLLVSFSIYSQDTYVRPSVSLINLNYNNNQSVLDLKSVKVPANLDQLELSKKQFISSTNAPRILLTSQIEGASLKDLKAESKAVVDKRNNTTLRSFITNKISNAAIMAVVPISNGEYNYDAVLKRGINSATDQDVNLTSQNKMSEVGSEEDRYLYVTEKMLNRNYVVAFNMGRFSSYSDEDSKGYEGSISFVIFKINSIYSAADGALTISANALPNAEVNAEIIASGKANFTSTNEKDQSLNKTLAIKPKSDAELKKDLQKLLVQSVWDKAMRKVDDFQPKTTLLAKRKISLGTKENLKIDNKFFIYENVQNNKGDIVKKKRSTMRVKKVANNDGKATGNSATSKLYKIGYGKAKEGMLVQQKEDLGVGISLGYGDLSWIRLDYRLKGITPGLLMFLDVHPYPGKVEFDMDAFNQQGSAAYLIDVYEGLAGFGGVNVEAGNFSANALSLYAGIEKQIRLGPALYLSPLIGAGYSTVSLSGDVLTISYGGESESLTWDPEESSIFESILAKGGARLGLQLSSSLSVNFTLAYLFPITGGWKDPKFVDASGEGYYNLGSSASGFGLFTDYTTAETDQDVLADYYNEVVKEMPAIPDGIQTAIMLRYEF
jgi:hypothetical protein